MLEPGTVVEIQIADVLDNIPPGDVFHCLEAHGRDFSMESVDEVVEAWDFIMNEKSEAYDFDSIINMIDKDKHILGYIAWDDEYSRYLLVDGHHRFTAAYLKYMTYDKIMIKVLPKVTYGNEIETSDRSRCISYAA